MTKVGEIFTGRWPEFPIDEIRLGMVIRYPGPKNVVRRGVVHGVYSDKVYVTRPDRGTDWCYTHEASEDRERESDEGLQAERLGKSDRTGPEKVG